MDKIMDNFGVFDYLETAEGTYEYTSEEMRSYFAAIVGNGVLKGVAGEFEASADGLTISLSTGEGWLLGVHGVIVNPVDFVMDPVVSGMSRICSIVMDVDTINQLMGISVLVGTQAESPSDPVLIETATRYQQLIHKAQIHDDGTITLTDSRSFVTRPGDGVDLTSIGGISFLANQPTITEEQKAQARANAGASSIPTDYSATLVAANWASARYTISHAAITANNAVLLTPPAGITAEQLNAIQSANIQRYSQANGQIVVQAYGTVPSIDVPLVLTIWG